MVSLSRGTLAVLLSLLAVSPAAGQDEATSSTVVLSEGYAGVYPDILRGRITASGAVYEPERLIASHRFLPLGSLVTVVNPDTGERVSVRILDRGPYVGGRVMDLSEAAARAIGIREGQERYVRVLHQVGGEVANRPAGGAAWDRAQERGGFTIQLGSYSSEAAAREARGRTEDAWVQAVEVDGQTFYRLNFGRYATRDQAEADLDLLEQRGLFGFVKSLAEGA